MCLVNVRFSCGTMVNIVSKCQSLIAIYWAGVMLIVLSKSNYIERSNEVIKSLFVFSVTKDTINTNSCYGTNVLV